jgi:hypothetical protein
MQTFSSCELNSIESALASTYDVSCTIKRPNGTQGSLGYQSNTPPPTPIATLYVGVKQPSASILALYADQVAAQITAQIRMPPDTDVQQQDLLVMGDQTLTVQVLLEPQSYNFELNVLASKVQGQVQNGG